MVVQSSEPRGNSDLGSRSPFLALAAILPLLILNYRKLLHSSSNRPSPRSTAGIHFRRDISIADHLLRRYQTLINARRSLIGQTKSKSKINQHLACLPLSVSASQDYDRNWMNFTTLFLFYALISKRCKANLCAPAAILLLFPIETSLERLAFPTAPTFA
ncbi:hypothetical protein VNO77_31303 [Canavalia gladiata]|uniref:Uncharacterized protein n=1 Tax=Canavalia gladiata TaxID=3824 RepID=A0AAN9KRU2_CANGL